MKDKENNTLNKTNTDNEQVITGIVDGAELPDEVIKQVSGGTFQKAGTCMF